MSTESQGVKIDGFLYPNFMKIPVHCSGMSLISDKKNHMGFLVQGSDGGGTFCLHFWNLSKIWI